MCLFFYVFYVDHLALLSFPTRRSSDLGYWPEQTPLSDVMSLPFMPIKSAEQGSEVLWKLYEKFPSIQKEYGDIQPLDRKSTRLNSSHLGISYAVFCLKNKTTHNERKNP